MEFFMGIAPVVIVGAIVVFVIERLKHKYNQGKKKSKGDQGLLDNIIPMGMLFGCTIGVIWSVFFQISLLSTVSLGAGIGYLFGYFAYEINN